MPDSLKHAIPLCGLAVAALLFSAGAQAAVQISGKATRNMSCSGGTCTPTAKTAVLNAGELAAMLASGDVKVISDRGASDIEVRAVLSWTSSHRLALDAFRAIVVSKPLIVAGTGGLTLTTNDGGANGDFFFSGEGHIEFWDLGSSLIINGNSYTLAGSIADLAADFDNNVSGLYALAKNYDASRDGTYAVSPITDIFNGTFEGLGNTISGFSLRLAAHSTTEGGLIQCACPGSVVRDIVLEHANVQGADNADVVGALAGLVYGTVKGASVSGSVRGSGDPAVNDTVGGLLGEAHGLVANVPMRK